MENQRPTNNETGLLSTNSQLVGSSTNNRNNRLGIGEYAIGRKPMELATYGLGSCVAVIIYDPQTKCGGLVHVMLPESKRDKKDNPWKYASTAVPRLYKHVSDHTSTPKSRLQAKLVGGSKMFEFVEFGQNIGKRNIETAKQELDELGIEIVGEDIGGEHGRRVIFNTDTGEVTVNTASSDNTIVL